jgi:uncharacterized NAD(P)/FAD-binding protein YdhS
MSSIMRIAIIGGGFTGTLLAANLMRVAPAALDIVLIERSGRAGAGLAYGTDNPDHLLNVRAERMSAFADDPDHFLRWLSSARPTARPTDFLPRLLYRSYLASILEEAATRRTGPARLAVRRTEAVGLRLTLSGVVIRLADGEDLACDHAVLCTGNQVPAPPAQFAASGVDPARILCDPNGTALAAVPPDDRVFIVGTGLTMVDGAVTLDGAGHRGRIVAVSRRGLLPRRHGPLAPLPPPLTPDRMRDGRLSLLLRDFRDAVDRADGDWRSVMDALRPTTQDLWAALPATARARFLRHLRPWWDVHRHRLAPDIADRIMRMQAEGRLQVLAGRLRSAAPDGAGIVCTVARRGSGEIDTIPAAWIVIATGPADDNSRHTLHASLIQSGQARACPLGLGLDVDADWSLVDASGVPSSRLSALGPPTRSRFWEIVAVPDIRDHCARLARRLVHEPATSHARMPRAAAAVRGA